MAAAASVMLQDWYLAEFGMADARQSAQYLGQELEGHLAAQEEGIGGESVDASTRKNVVQQRKELRGAVMKEAVSGLPNQTLMPAERDETNILGQDRD